MTRHLLVIGAQRCGTTYLHALLDAHPDITMARPARPEPKVFLSPELTARGLQWYESTYFAHATTESLLGEKSTSYLEIASAAGRAAGVLGNAEILVMLRDPVPRAISNWQFSTANGLEDRPLVQALTENLAGAREWDPAATSVSPYAYLERGRYSDFLEPWFTHFPHGVHVRFFEEFVGSDTVLAGLYESLGVDPEYRPVGLGRKVNQSEGTAPGIDPALVERLRDFFGESDTLLRKMLGRELPWTGK